MNANPLSTTALVIVAAGLSIGQANADLAVKTNPITTEICQSLHEPRVNRAFRRVGPQVSDKVYGEQTLSADDWSRSMMGLLDRINNERFDSGELTVNQCIGSSSNPRVRARHYELDNLYRSGNERRGWRISVEAEDQEAKVLRLLRLMMPSEHLWTVNAAGDGLIASFKVEAIRLR